MTVRIAAIFLGILAFGGLGWGAGSAPSVEDQVRELGDERIERRDQAQAEIVARLVGMARSGDPAEWKGIRESLRAAVRSEDPEVAQRAGALLRIAQGEEPIWRSQRGTPVDISEETVLIHVGIHPGYRSSMGRLQDLENRTVSLETRTGLEIFRVEGTPLLLLPESCLVAVYGDESLRIRLLDRKSGVTRAEVEFKGNTAQAMVDGERVVFRIWRDGEARYVICDRRTLKVVDDIVRKELWLDGVKVDVGTLVKRGSEKEGPHRAEFFTKDARMAWSLGWDEKLFAFEPGPEGAILAEGYDSHRSWLVLLDAESGTKRWRRDLPLRVQTKLLIPEGILVASHRSLALIDSANGKTLWDRKTTYGPSSLVRIGDKVLAASPSNWGGLYDLKTGMPSWETRTYEFPRLRQELLCLETDGINVFGGGGYCPCVVMNGTTSWVVRFTMKDASTMWEAKLDGAVYRVVLAGDRVLAFLADRMGGRPAIIAVLDRDSGVPRGMIQSALYRPSRAHRFGPLLLIEDRAGVEAFLLPPAGVE